MMQDWNRRTGHRAVPTHSSRGLSEAVTAALELRQQNHPNGDETAANLSMVHSALTKAGGVITLDRLGQATAGMLVNPRKGKLRMLVASRPDLFDLVGEGLFITVRLVSARAERTPRPATATRTGIYIAAVADAPPGLGNSLDEPAKPPKSDTQIEALLSFDGFGLAGVGAAAEVPTTPVEGTRMVMRMMGSCPIAWETQTADDAAGVRTHASASASAKASANAIASAIGDSAGAAATSHEDPSSPSPECQLCMENPIDIVLMPCKHVVMCR
jgi:hypothetical protein